MYTLTDKQYEEFKKKATKTHGGYYSRRGEGMLEVLNKMVKSKEYKQKL